MCKESPQSQENWNNCFPITQTISSCVTQTISSFPFHQPQDFPKELVGEIEEWE